MALRRKDSFLWGKATLLPEDSPGLSRFEEQSSAAAETRPSVDVQTLALELLDDIQKLRLDIKPDTDPGVEEKNEAVCGSRFLRGKKKFNMDPKTGIQYLVENELLEWKPQSLANFLYKEEGLNKTAIGNFLGERDQMHLEVLKAFVGLHEFSDLNLVQALRQFLWSFRLPGEAQKIDRMMEAFAARYCDCNPGVFQSTDTCYILSFAVIMLNTSLHNPNVRDKPGLQRFVATTQGIDDGRDLPDDLLTKLYTSIRSEPFKIPEDDGNDLTLTFFNPEREGWLMKLGGQIKTWKRRWFILTDSCLYYFKYTTDKDPIGIIPLENLTVKKLQNSSKPYCLELYNCRGQKIKACKTQNKGGVIPGKHQSYRLCAASEDERDDWMDAIRASVTKDPFHDLVSSRKRKLTSSS